MVFYLFFLENEDTSPFSNTYGYLEKNPKVSVRVVKFNEEPYVWEMVEMKWDDVGMM